jgi:hypothetical protein
MVAMRAVTIAIVTVLAAWAATAATAGTESASAKMRRVGSAGVSLAVPAKWKTIPASKASKWSGVVEPKTRLVVSTGPIGFGKGCNDIDYDIGPRSAAIVVVEWIGATPGAHFTPRPKRFSTRTLPVRPNGVECFSGLGGALQFEHKGRRFAAYLLIGTHARYGVITRARHALSTLRVAKR